MAALDEDLIREQVDRFYTRVREDAELGPIFVGRIEDWDAHIERLVAFWSSIMLKSGRYKGNPFAAHLPFATELNAALFERWLELWRLTAHETVPAEVAAQFDIKAQRIAASLRAGLLFRCEATPTGTETSSASRPHRSPAPGSHPPTTASARQG